VEPALKPRTFAGTLAVIFAITAIIDLGGSPYIRVRFRQWQHPRQFYRVMGVLQLITSLFLAIPQLRIWGFVLARLTCDPLILTLPASQRQ
jgi:hypothetical protein